MIRNQWKQTIDAIMLASTNSPNKLIFTIKECSVVCFPIIELHKGNWLPAVSSASINSKSPNALHYPSFWRAQIKSCGTDLLYPRVTGGEVCKCRSQSFCYTQKNQANILSRFFSPPRSKSNLDISDILSALASWLGGATGVFNVQLSTLLSPNPTSHEEFQTPIPSPFHIQQLQHPKLIHLNPSQVIPT